MQSKPILIIGTTGKTGSRVAAKLDGLYYKVRPGSRRAGIHFDWELPTHGPRRWRVSARPM